MEQLMHRMVKYLLDTLPVESANAEVLIERQATDGFLGSRRRTRWINIQPGP
jgi:hypothetical protein